MSGTSVAIECALRRARTRKGRLLATIAAVAVGIAGLMLVAVAGTIAGDRALQRGVAGLEPSERAFAVTMSPDLTPTAADLAAGNETVDARWRSRGLGPVLRTVEYRALAAGDGRTVRFAAIDEISRSTRLVDGNWPTRCDADRCEVLAVVPESASSDPVAPLPPNSPLGLTIVGTGVATTDLLLSGVLQPDEEEQILLADGVATASALPGYELIRRSYAWQTAVLGDQLSSDDVIPLLAAVRSLSGDPQFSGLHVSGPEDELLSISARTRISGNRLVVPIAAVLVLFFGVAALAGLAGRADHQRASSLLRRRGAEGPVVGLFRFLEAGLPVVSGAVVGLGAGLSLGAWSGRRAGLGGWNVVRRAVDGDVVTRLVAVTVAVWVLIVAVLSIRDAAPAHRRRRPLASDVAGVTALAMLAVLVGRGTISTGSLNREVDPALVAVPILAAVALASIVVRLVPLILRAASSASPRRWPLTKLTLAEATAQPLRSIATAALIAITVMFALLTFGYGSTLRQGSRDQAAFAVPYDFRLQLGSALVRPQALAPPEGWSNLVPGTTATDVLRRGVAVRRSATNLQTVELLGLDPATLEHLNGWRPSFGPDPADIADSIDEPALEALGPSLPADATSIEFSGSGLAGLHIAAVIARVDGTWHEITLDEELEGSVRADLTPGDAGGHLVGFRLAQLAEVSALAEHHIGEGTTSLEARPVDVTLQRVHVADAEGRATDLALRVDQLRAADAVVAAEQDGAVHVTGSLLGVAILVTPAGPGQEQPLDAIMDPVTASAAVDGIVAMETSRGTLHVRPAVVVNRFPGAGARFAIVDISALQPALDLIQPSAGTPNEVWLAADTAAHEQQLGIALAQDAFAPVEVDVRTTRQEALATDPLSIATLLVLSSSALVAIVLGACAVLFGAAADASDDRPLLRMLALERVGGGRLLRMVAGKSFGAVCLAIPLGLIAGRWLLQITTRLVAVTATSGRPNPPLRLTVPWLAVGALSIALVAGLGVAAAAGAVSARRVPDEDLMRGTA